MLVANASAKGEQPADINDLAEWDGIASAREPFDHFLLIDSGLLTHDEIDCLRPRLHEEQARGTDDEYGAAKSAAPVRLVKVHDAYTLTPNGEPLLAGARAAQGAIVIVRDPRDVVPSLANHLKTDIDAAIAFLNDKDSGFCTKTNLQFIQLRQRFVGWSGHIASWLEQRDIPIHIVRYEDLVTDAVNVFRAAMDFAGRPVTLADAERAARLADFAILQQQEREKGFREWNSRGRGKLFFRRGKAGAWRDELTAQQIARIEVEHAQMMLRLGYELSTKSNLADAIQRD
jgi:hypothetical protein